jgi:hypothetical protein
MSNWNLWINTRDEKERTQSNWLKNSVDSELPNSFKSFLLSYTKDDIFYDVVIVPATQSRSKKVLTQAKLPDTGGTHTT